jgi:hypothetical protein
LGLTTGLLTDARMRVLISGYYITKIFKMLFPCPLYFLERKVVRVN